MAIIKEYKFKIDFVVAKDRLYKKGTKIVEVPGQNMYKPIGKEIYRPIEGYFVENNPAIFDNITRVSGELIDNNRYIIQSIARSGTRYVVMHQSGSDLYVRKGVTGTPFMLTSRSVIEQFEVNEYHDGKKNILYIVGAKITLIGGSKDVYTIRKIDFDGTATVAFGKKFKVDTYELASMTFKGYDKDILYPNKGYAINIVTGKFFEVEFKDLHTVNMDAVKIFALLENRYKYMNTQQYSQYYVDSLVKVTKACNDKVPAGRACTAEEFPNKTLSTWSDRGRGNGKGKGNE